MAASSPDKDDEISCSVCMEVFNDPRTIPCGHTFCRECLQNLFNSSKKTQAVCRCPNCRKSVSVPNQSKPVSTHANQFPRNVALIQAIDTINKLKQRDVLENTEQLENYKKYVRSICDTLEWFNKSLQSQMKSETERLEKCIHLSVIETAKEIDRRGDAIVAGIRSQQAKLKKDLEHNQRYTVNEITKLFTQHKLVIDKGTKVVKLGQELLKSGTASELEKNIPKFSKVKNTTSDFVNRIGALQPVTELRISLATPDTCVVSIGQIVLPDIKSLVSARASLLNVPTLQVNRNTDKLIHKGGFNTQANDVLAPGIQGITVLDGELSNTIVVTDSINTCVKCFCADTHVMRCKFEPGGSPCGLAKFCDQQVAVVLPIEHQIIFLNIHDDVISQTNTLRTERRYYCISVLPNRCMIVTGGSSSALSVDNQLGRYVDVLNEEGSVLQSVIFDKTIEPWCLAINGDYLVVVSDSQSLTFATSSGPVACVSVDQQRQHQLRGVTCDAEEFVYVCSDSTNCVIQLSRDGKIIRDILTSQDGLLKPTYICCDRDTFYVAQQNGEVKVYTWNED